VTLLLPAVLLLLQAVISVHTELVAVPVIAGDAITLKTRDGDFEYLVESTAVVGPSDIQVLLSTGGRILTLITCFRLSYLGSALDRFSVRAREVQARAIAT
jgi:LPXTG-site transpeptidase (sortase) family protein